MIKIRVKEFFTNMEWDDDGECMGCPYGSYKHDTEKELELINDNQKKFVCEYFKESYEVLGIEVKE